MIRHQGIERAALEIAFSNGAINRDRTERQFLRVVRDLISRHPQETLGPIDSWLMVIGYDEMELVCDGEESERAEFMAGSPPFTEALLQEIFEKAC